MKVRSPIITLFVLLNTITSDAALAQDPTEKEDHKVQATLAQKQAAPANQQAELAKQTDELFGTSVEAKTPSSYRPRAALELKKALLDMTLTRTKYGAERVLMVLTGHMKAEDIVATTEDLNVMSRILDKKLGHALPIPTIPGEIVNMEFRNLLHPQNRSIGTHAIYLQDYGTLFFMNVDFPLSAPPKVQVAAMKKVDEDIDPLWELTKREISQKEPDVNYVVDIAEYNAAVEYDAEKVEELKTKLTKALGHAANIRNLKADESIILVVAGTRQPAVALTEVAIQGGKTYRVLSKIDEGSLFGPRLLTIRAKKSDIDAYTKGKLDFNEFREKAKTLTSHAKLSPTPADEVKWRSRY